MAKPSKIEQHVDRLWLLRAKRLEAQREVDKLKEGEQEMVAALERMLHEAKQELAHGALATAAIRRTTVPQITDEDALLAWGRKKGNRAVLKVSVITAEWRAKLADGITVDGVAPFTKEDLTLVKAGNRA